MRPDSAAADLRELAARVEISGPAGFSIDGRSRESRADGLAADLARSLYKVYSRLVHGSRRPVDETARRSHVAALAAANPAKRTWDPDWRVHAVDEGGELAVEKDGVVFFSPPAQVRVSDGERPAPDMPCRVAIPAEQRELLEGYVLVHGGADRAPAACLTHRVRLYWHLRALDAVEWVAAATVALDDLGIPFSLKVPADPRDYRRADAGIVYLEPDHLTRSWPAIGGLYERVGGRLGPEVPYLTLRLAPGLGLAEGPADGASFGEARCELIAEALVAGFAARGRLTRETATAAVETAFRRAGLDPARPWLAPGSGGGYEGLPAFSPPPKSASRLAAESDFFAAAGRIGDDLCRDAHWHQGCCNWTGRSAAESGSRRRKATPTVQALMADLYGGTAGVGLFLAELFRSSGDEAHRRTSRGALRQALGAVREKKEAYRPLAFYSGGLGVAWAGHRVARLVEDEDLAAAAGTLMAECLAGGRGDHRLDVMSGRAGSILGLLALNRDAPDRRALETAVESAEEILARARRVNGKASWANKSMAGMAHGEPPLTGFSHGVGGVGLALLELGTETGRQDFRATARAAFAYEDSHYDAGRGNWPDFRSAGGGGARFRVAWCHGSGGIALVRLRATEIDPDRRRAHAKMARQALETTRRSMGLRLAADGADTTLCHGLGGMIEMLQMAGEVFGDDVLRREAKDTMRLLVARHGANGDWPSGTPSRGPNPSLFLGAAGIGYTLLRLAGGGRVPSVLLPSRPVAGRALYDPLGSEEELSPAQIEHEREMLRNPAQ